MDLFLEAYSLLRDVLEAEDTGKPHQLATRAAFRASAAADELGDNLRYGRIGPEDADKVRDAHKSAYDLHMGAAKSNRQSNQLGTAASHMGLAGKHGKLAAHYHTLHQAAGSAPKKAVGEIAMRGSGYPSLLEACGPMEGKVSPDEIDGTDDEFDLDEDGVPAAVRHHARSIEKAKGLKLRSGGAKSKAGVAYAIAWKNYCDKNRNSSHCKK